MVPVIRFSLAGIPVVVRPSFWLVAVLLGFTLGDTTLLFAWIGVVFVSVLAHELGHALTARRYGAQVSIQLTTLGGLTTWQLPQGAMSPGRRALVAAAGSAVGIVLGLAVLGAYLLVRPAGELAAFLVNMVVWVNVGWGILNWLPIRPLDGGHLLTSFLEIVAPKRGDRIADVVFLVTSILALGAALYLQFLFVAILAGFMTWSEVQRHLSSPKAPVAAEPFGYDDHPKTEETGETPR